MKAGFQNLGAQIAMLGRGTVHAEAGDSQVDLLLKRSTQLQVELGEEAAEAIEQNKSKIQSEIQAAQSQQDLLRIAMRYVGEDGLAKLGEALGLIKQAEALDPSSVAALIQEAQVSFWLSPDDKASRRKMLRTAIGYLGVPEGEKERTQLAEATFMLALNSEPVDPALLMQARSMFDALGRKEYVEQINLMLGQSGGAGAQWGAGQGQPVRPPPPTQAQIYGRWVIQSGNGTVADVVLNPNGSYQGTIKQLGIPYQTEGVWGFEPYSMTLNVQGRLSTGVAYMNRFMIQGQQGGGHVGVDAFGIPFAMTKM
jgi:hypothetical protein